MAAKQTEQERINSSGFARGWHAERLQEQAKAAARTMADQFRLNIQGAAAYNILAECTGIRGGIGSYKFMDGSTDKYVHQQRKENR